MVVLLLLRRRRAINIAPPTAMVVMPSINTHTMFVDDGEYPPVSGVLGAGRGVAVGNGSGAPLTPTATVAGSKLTLPQTRFTPFWSFKTELTIVSESLSFTVTMLSSLMLPRNMVGMGAHTSAGVFRR